MAVDTGAVVVRTVVEVGLTAEVVAVVSTAVGVVASVEARGRSAAETAADRQDRLAGREADSAEAPRGWAARDLFRAHRRAGDLDRAVTRVALTARGARPAHAALSLMATGIRSVAAGGALPSQVAVDLRPMGNGTRSVVVQETTSLVLVARARLVRLAGMRSLGDRLAVAGAMADSVDSAVCHSAADLAAGAVDGASVGVGA